MRVVLHVNELDKWPMTLANVENLRKSPEITGVCVVLNGEGVDLAIKEAIDIDATVFVCENSMRSRDIAVEDLKEGFQPTPSAVVLLTKLQHDLYAYIKP